MTPQLYTLDTHWRGDTWPGLGPLWLWLTGGDEITVTATAATDVLNATSHGLSDGDRLRLLTTGTAPGGLSARNYYVVSSTTYTFKVSLTSGGAAVDITSTGSGTHTVQLLEPPGEDLAGVSLQFRRGSRRGTVGVELTEADGITITDAVDWEITIPALAPEDFDLAAGEWHWDLETTDDAGTVRTWLYGILTVEDDATRVEA
jgi:hypothetical protein